MKKGVLVVFLLMFVAISATLAFGIVDGQDCKQGSHNSPDSAAELVLDGDNEGMICSHEKDDWYKVTIPAGKTLHLTGFEMEDGYFAVESQVYDAAGAKKLKDVDGMFTELQFTNDGQDGVFLVKFFVHESFTNMSYKIYARLLDEPFVRQF